MQRLAKLKEEWQKLETEKQSENMTVQRGTGKYILEMLFGKKKKKKRRKKTSAQCEISSSDDNEISTSTAAAADVVVPLDAFKNYKFTTPKFEGVGDLVDVVSLPSSYEGSTTPPLSPRSLYTLNSSGIEKKKKKKKKSKKQIEREQKKLKEKNEQYMEEQKISRERLMLDFSKLNKSVPLRNR